MATKTLPTTNAAWLRTALLGAGAGLVGGLVFGLMMASQGMLPMVGMLIGQDNATVGFIVHMVISAFIGATFGVIATRFPSGWAASIVGGGIYGVIWWVLGALILMPLMLGMSHMVLQIGDMQISSLIGHVIFGVLMGAAHRLLVERL